MTFGGSEAVVGHMQLFMKRWLFEPVGVHVGDAVSAGEGGGRTEPNAKLVDTFGLMLSP